MDDTNEGKLPEETSQNQAPQSNLKQIRTFQGDVAYALQRQKESLVSIQQVAAEKRRTDGINPEIESKRKDFLFLFIGSIFFIAAGGFAAWYGYNEIQRRNSPPVTTIPDSRFVSPNTEAILNVASSTRESFAVKFGEAVSDLPSGQLSHVILKEGNILQPTANFLRMIEARAPGSLIRAFDKNFMIGALGNDQFLIIKLTSFENAFAGMLSWETDMAEDMIPVFSNANSLQALEGNYVFKDVIVKNKDVRVLEAPEIGPVLMYSFFDNNMLIITESIETLQTLIDRLTREKLSR